MPGSIESADVTPQPEAVAVRARRSTFDRYAFPLGLFAVLALLVFVDGQLSMRHLAFTELAHGWPDQGATRTFARYDSGWYFHIATQGYFYNGPTQQSAVAFFPAYPSAMRLAAFVLPNAIVGGVLVTLLCGAGVAAAFWRWCRAAFGERPARFAVAALLLYPFAFYLFGAVYSDALFILAVLVSFSLLEDERPVLAGLVGIVATAARPVGIALVAGLVLRQLEIRAVIRPSRPAFFAGRRARGTVDDDDRSVECVPLVPRTVRLRNLRAGDAGVLLSVGGLVAYCAFLAWRFGEPLAFQKVASSAPGWGREVDLRTVLHVLYFQLLQSYGMNVINFWLTMQGLFSLIALGSIPVIARRLGRGYALYVLVAVGLAFVSQAQFIGMGRYVLAAFPAFAVIGRWFATRQPGTPQRWIPVGAYAVSAVLLAWMSSLYARWVFLS